MNSVAHYEALLEWINTLDIPADFRLDVDEWMKYIRHDGEALRLKEIIPLTSEEAIEQRVLFGISVLISDLAIEAAQNMARMPINVPATDIAASIYDEIAKHVASREYFAMTVHTIIVHRDSDREKPR